MLRSLETQECLRLFYKIVSSVQGTLSSSKSPKLIGGPTAKSSTKNSHRRTYLQL